VTGRKVFLRLAFVALPCAALGCNFQGWKMTDPGGQAANPFHLNVHSDFTAELEKTRPQGGVPVKLTSQVTSNSADVTYKTTLSVADKQKLVVQPRAGEAVEFTDRPLSAEYFHVGRVLVVSEGADAARKMHHFVEPVSWSTVPVDHKQK
jgi:hypothetical protein